MVCVTKNINVHLTHIGLLGISNDISKNIKKNAKKNDREEQLEGNSTHGPLLLHDEFEKTNDNLTIAHEYSMDDNGNLIDIPKIIRIRNERLSEEIFI